jgi:hypothetical protein
MTLMFVYRLQYVNMALKNNFNCQNNRKLH